MCTTLLYDMIDTITWVTEECIQNSEWNEIELTFIILDYGGKNNRFRLKLYLIKMPF